MNKKRKAAATKGESMVAEVKSEAPSKKNKTVENSGNQYGNSDSHISVILSKNDNTNSAVINQEVNFDYPIDVPVIPLADIPSETDRKLQKSTVNKGKRSAKTKVVAAAKSKAAAAKTVMSAETDKDDQVTQLPLNKGKKGVANTNITSSNPTDPFVGKAVAFGCNSDFGKELRKEFGKKWVKEAVCYHLDEKVRHLVGTVMQRSRGLGKYHQKQINYDVA